MKYPKTTRIFFEACRIILATTFIFSGFVKAVDPWGTAIKIGEYLAAFDMEWLYGWRFILSIWLSGAEMMLGCMVLFKVRLRLTSIFIFCTMIFFTGLTLVLAILDPIEDCGCFGDAIRLTNWETFIKNMVLLPMSFIVFWSSRRLPWIPTWRDGAFMLFFGTIAFGIGVYSYLHLPLIDFLPYKVGTDLATAVHEPATGEVETIVICRNIETGETMEFDINDTEWCDESKWEYIDVRNTAIHTRVHPTVRDFAIIDGDSLITDAVLAEPGVVYMVCMSSLKDLGPGCERKLETAVSQAYGRGYHVVCLTSEPLGEYPEVMLGAERVKCYNMDATTLKTMLRAKVGVVVLKGGVIVDKENCRDLLDRRELPVY